MKKGVLNGDKKKKPKPTSKQKLPVLSKEIHAIELFKNPVSQRWLMAILLAVFITLFLSPNINLPFIQYEVGEVASKDVKSPKDFLVEDTQSTIKRIGEAKKSVVSVYDFDSNQPMEIEKKLVSSFTLMRDFYEGLEDKIRGKSARSQKERNVIKRRMAVKIDLTPFKDQIETKRDEFEKILGIKLMDEEFKILQRHRFNRGIERYVGILISTNLEKKIVGNKELLQMEIDRGIIVRNIQTRKELDVRDILAIWDLKDAQKAIETNSKKILDGLEDSLRNTIVRISQRLIKPNLTFNGNETEQRRIKIVQSVKPVFYQVKKGEIIVREGERIQNEHLVKLQEFQKVREYNRVVLTSFGLILLFVLMSYVLYIFFLRGFKEVLIKNKDLLLLSIIIGVVVLLTKLAVLICDAMNDAFPFIPYDSFIYAIPIASGAMLITIMMNAKVALFFSIIISFCTGILIENRIEFIIYPFIGSIIAAQGVIKAKLRATLIKVGVLVGLVNIITIISLNMVKGYLFNFTSLFDIAFGFLGGVFVGFIVVGTTPLFETLFDYPTDIKLLELANLDNPLLRELIVQAPGTYHHSIIVGSLAEAAAESINANPLFAMVGAYYHDIGKIKKPLYFIENQRGAENKHEKLAPSMSSLILHSHVKDGVEIAKESKLGKPIIDIIQQHHGTSLITYFYQKAKDREDSGLCSVDEKDYRYPGPKPQTKEAGLVMLADAVEAASKTLPDPSPSRIQGMVQKIINNMFADGQLNECELTLKDLNEIAKTFNKILTGIFHHRIDYPEVAYKEASGKRKVDDPDKKSTKEDKVKRAEDKRNSENDLRRLGIP
ncbi:MAG: HDIG domain-containing protein [Thermodesulfobacteriota bacterium]|nr:HDIG domain-containing protein [Thermodesulfobacteriota bacterium]